MLDNIVALSITHRLLLALVLALSTVQLDDVLEQRGVPHTSIVRVHGVAKVLGAIGEVLKRGALGDALERQHVVAFVEQLAQHGRLHVAAEIEGDLDHAAHNVVVEQRPLQVQRAVLGAGEQGVHVARHGAFVVFVDYTKGIFII